MVSLRREIHFFGSGPFDLGSFGGGPGSFVGAFGRTVTDVVQDAVFFAASVAVHAIAVVPTLNWEPDFGVHCTATGDAPPLNVGAANSTLVFPPPPVSVTGAITGQLIVSGGSGGGGGGSTTGATITTVDVHEAL